MSKILSSVLIIGSLAICPALAEIAPAQDRGQEPRDRMIKYGVTADDIGIVDRDLVAAHSGLSGIWNAIFARNQLSFVAPTLSRYVRNGEAYCGPAPVPIDNAYYCRGNNTIGYDPIFLAKLKKDVSRRLNRTADRTPILVLAHEWGHAIAFRLGLGKVNVLQAVENDADCFAGVGFKELFFASSPPESENTSGRGSRSHELVKPLSPQKRMKLEVDTTYALLATQPSAWRANHSHGSVTDRQRHFNTGFDEGPKSCRLEKQLSDQMRKRSEELQRK